MGFSVAILSLAATVGFGVWDLFLKPRPVSSIHVQSSGGNSPNIVDNQGNVTIQTPEEDKAKKPTSGEKHQ